MLKIIGLGVSLMGILLAGCATTTYVAPYPAATVTAYPATVTTYHPAKTYNTTTRTTTTSYSYPASGATTIQYYPAGYYTDYYGYYYPDAVYYTPSSYYYLDY
ncbi:MAG TPA: hypothetical protein VHE99_06865 [Gammaproteobacteria bacterium]|nr:hypothetical protein [Gammaproteobacteria bacterium]